MRALGAALVATLVISVCAGQSDAPPPAVRPSEGPTYRIESSGPEYRATADVPDLASFSGTSASDVVQQAYDAVKATGGTIRFGPGRYRWTNCVRINPGHQSWVSFVGDGLSTVLDLDERSTGAGTTSFFCISSAGHPPNADYQRIWFEGLYADSHFKKDETRKCRVYSFFGEDVDATGGFAVNSAVDRGFNSIVVKDVWNWNVYTMGTREFDRSDPCTRNKRGGLGFHAKQTNRDVAAGHRIRISDIVVDNYHQFGGNQAVFAGCYNFDDSSRPCLAYVENVRISNSSQDMNVRPGGPGNPTSDHAYKSTCFHLGGQGARAVRHTRLEDNVCVDSGDNCVELNMPEDVRVVRTQCIRPYQTGLTVVNFGNPVEAIENQQVVVAGWEQDCRFPPDYPISTAPPSRLTCSVAGTACANCVRFNQLSLQDIFLASAGPPNWMAPVWTAQGSEVRGVHWDRVAVEADVVFSGHEKSLALWSFQTHAVGWSAQPGKTSPDGADGITISGYSGRYRLRKEADTTGARRLWPLWIGGHELAIVLRDLSVEVTMESDWSDPAADFVAGVLWSGRTRVPRQARGFITPSILQRFSVRDVSISARSAAPGRAVAPRVYALYLGDSKRNTNARDARAENLDLAVEKDSTAGLVFAVRDAPRVEGADTAPAP